MMKRFLKNDILWLKGLFLSIFIMVTCVYSSFAQTDLKVKKVEVDKEKRNIQVEVEGGVGPYTVVLTKLENRPLRFVLEQKKISSSQMVIFEQCNSKNYQIGIEDSEGEVVHSEVISFND